MKTCIAVENFIINGQAVDKMKQIISGSITEDDLKENGDDLCNILALTHDGVLHPASLELIGWQMTAAKLYAENLILQESLKEQSFAT